MMNLLIVKNIKINLCLLLCFAATLHLKAQTPLDTAVNFTVKDVKGVTHHLNEYLE